MNILQITSIGNNKSSGIRNVVPINIKHLSKKENVIWINLIKEFDLEITFSKKSLKFINNLKILEIKSNLENIDLVVFHGIFFIKYCLISFFLRRKNIPYIIIPHGSLTKNALGIKKMKKKIFMKLIFKKFIKNALAIQYLTLGEKANSITFNNDSIVIPNGIIENSSNENKFKEKNEIKVVFIARKLYEHKGIDILLEACRNYKNKLKRHRVIIELYGPSEKKVTKKIEKTIKDYKIEDIIKNKKEIYDKEKEEILINSDVFILTSKSEGHPMGVIEALSYKKPCLLTEGTNLTAEIKKYNAGWTAKNNSESIGEALLKMISDKNHFLEIGENAYRLSKEYSWDKIVDKTLGQYKELLLNLDRKEKNE